MCGKQHSATVSNYIPDEAEFIGLNLLDHGTVLLNYYLNAVQSQSLITAYSSNGQIQWALPFLNPSIRLYQVAIDNSGNIYATGSFGGLQDFDPGPGEFILDSHSGHVYLCKFNINSEFLWAAQWGAHAVIRGNWITTDPNGNIYIAGRFSGYADFDPGPDEYVRLGDTSNSSYVSVFDPSGNWMWMGDWSAYICEDSGSTDTPEHPIVAMHSGNTYITGIFYGTQDFNPTWDVSETTSGDESETYLLKILPPGVW